MGKKKTSNRGRKPDKYEKLSKEEKHEYHHNAVRKYRGQSPVSSRNPKTTLHNTTIQGPSSSSHNTPASRGRPPLLGLVAMTPDTLRGRKWHLMKEKRKQKRRAKRAAAAARLRFSSPESVGTDCTSDEDFECILTDDESEHDETQNDVDMENVVPAPSILSPEALRKSIYRAKCRLTQRYPDKRQH